MHRFLATLNQRDLSALSKRNAFQRGMTLVEIMVVVVIISLVTGVVGVAVLNRLDDAKKKLAGTQLRQISDGLELYKLSLRNYPSTSEGIQALVTPKNNEKPFLPSVPKDPWGNDYVYVFSGSAQSFRLRPDELRPRRCTRRNR